MKFCFYSHSIWPQSCNTSGDISCFTLCFEKFTTAAPSMIFLLSSKWYLKYQSIFWWPYLEHFSVSFVTKWMFPWWPQTKEAWIWNALMVWDPCVYRVPSSLWERIIKEYFVNRIFNCTTNVWGKLQTKCRQNMLFLNKCICCCFANVRVLKLHRIFVKIANEIGFTSTLQKKSVKTKLNIFSVLLIQNQCRFYTTVEFIIHSLNNSSYAHKFFKIRGKMLTFF